MNKENELLEQKELREKLVGRVEVLGKVKELLSLPNTDLSTTNQAAEYYEVTEEVIRQNFVRNNDELLSDGAKTIEGNELRDIKSLSGLKTRAKSITIFPRRAILRLGMLLRDSEVAKEVRTQLLNIEEQTTDEQKVKEINKEDDLLLKIIHSENVTERAVAISEYKNYTDRYINTLENKIDSLVEGILKWDKRKGINKMVRLIANSLYKSDGIKRYATAWGKLREEMLYRHSINVNSRLNHSPKKKPTIFDVLDEEELKLAVKTCVALCEENNINIDDLMVDDK